MKKEEKKLLEETKKQTRAMRISAISSILAIVVSIAAFIFSIISFNLSEREDLDVYLSNFVGDYETEFPILQHTSDCRLYALFNCIISNNSAKVVSIVDFDFMEKKGNQLRKHSWDLSEGLYKDFGKPEKLPIIIKPQDNIRLFVYAGIEIKDSFCSRLVDFLFSKKHHGLKHSIYEIIKYLSQIKNSGGLTKNSIFNFQRLEKDIGTTYIVKVKTMQGNYFQGLYSGSVFPSIYEITTEEIKLIKKILR